MVLRGPGPAQCLEHGDADCDGKAYAVGVRQRWFSRRALFLHCEFWLIAFACLAAGWWQVTRALSGNGLSWVYSIEWPAFAILSIAGWWHLIHEDPEAYKARKRPSPDWEASDGVLEP